MNRINATIYVSNGELISRQRKYFLDRFLNQLLDKNGYLIHAYAGHIFTTKILDETIFFRFFPSDYGIKDVQIKAYDL